MIQHGHVETFHVIAVSSDAGCRNPGSIEGSCRIERTDGDVISVRVPERELHGASVWIHMRLFFQPADQRAPPRQSHLEVVDPEEQEEAVARLGVAGTCQRGMLVGTPLVETKQDRSIRVDDLPEVVVGRSRLRQAKQRLVPFEALGHVSDANDRPRALHRLLCGQTIAGLIPERYRASRPEPRNTLRGSDYAPRNPFRKACLRLRRARQVILWGCRVMCGTPLLPLKS